MAMQKRRIDRAQRFRARRVWWERHGSFARGLLTGTLVTLLAVWLTKIAMATF
ncbi:MAG: hypothetical protein WA047_00095 [Phenylobacterium sp.]|uniref:hypothetical protein n=1 Tax=Phenylobacterium sp. TaxID=1871053 RepID=UPI003BB6FE07